MNKLNRSLLLWAASAAVFAGAVHCAEIRLRGIAGGTRCVNCPVCAPITLPKEFEGVEPGEISVELREERKGSNKTIPGQVVLNGDQAEIWFVVPAAEPNSTTTIVATLTRRKDEPKEAFNWAGEEGKRLDLLYGDRLVTRYMYEHDPSNPLRLHVTYKPYHHVYDLSGKQELTKGPGGLYTHHRGIFIGWNKLTFEGKRYDTWHMKSTTLVHQKLLGKEAGPVLARSKSLIHWNDAKKEPLVAEERETVVFQQPKPTVLLLEFRTTLKAVRGDVTLDGDPEHGGFQYRPRNDVDTKATQYLFHADGINPRKDKDLPWVGMSYTLGGKRYSVQHINHQDNPKGTVYSAYRDYGRFGAFFKKQIKSGESLSLRYRIYVVEGDMPPREEMQMRWESFVNPPKIETIH